MNSASIHEHYAKDHDRLEQLFRRFQAQKSSDRKAAFQEFEQFSAGLEQHIVWEEEILFPSFERKL